MSAKWDLSTKDAWNNHFHSSRVAHFLVFQFPVGKREKWPISWSGKTRKSGKFFTVTRMSNFWVDFVKILKTFEMGPIVIFANGKSFLDGTQMLVYSQNWNFGQFYNILVNYGQNQEIFQEKCNFLEEISWSLISCFLVFYQEMCNSS